MSETKKKGMARGLLLAAPVLLALPPVAALVLRTQGGPAVLFLALWVFLPGCALARALGVRRGDGLYPLYAFFMGAAALFVLFYLCRTGPLVWVLRLLPPAAGLAWAVARLAGACRGGRLAGLARGAAGQMLKNWPMWWLAAAGVWLSFTLTALAFSGPAQLFGADYHWHMGNIHTLASSPGFEDIRVAGMTFRYHYFSDMIWAAGRLAVGLDPFYCVARYPALVTPVLCAAAVWQLVARAARRTWLRAAAAFAVLFAAPLYGVYNDFTYQWATNINAVGFALPCALLLMMHTERALRGARAGWRDAVLAGVLAALTAGFKGPFAVCALAAVCGGLVARRLAGRRPARGWYWVLLAGTAGFGLVWFALLSAGMNDSYVRSWQPFYSVYTAQVLAPLLTTPLESPAWLRGLLVPVHLVVVLGVVAVPFVAACVRFVARVARRRPFADRTVFMLAAAVASLLVFYLLDLAGRSQFYFLYFAVPPAGAVAAREVERHWLPALKKHGRRWLRRGLALAACAAMAFAAANTMVEWGKDYFAQEEYDAALWLRDNMPEEDRAAINRHGALYFFSGVTGRRFWLEGDEYAKNSGLSKEMLAGQRERGDALFSGETRDKAALADELGVQWLVQYTYNAAEKDLYAPPGEGFELLFENEVILVWRRDTPESPNR